MDLYTINGLDILVCHTCLGSYEKIGEGGIFTLIDEKRNFVEKINLKLIIKSTHGKWLVPDINDINNNIYISSLIAEERIHSNIGRFLERNQTPALYKVKSI